MIVKVKSFLFVTLAMMVFFAFFFGAYALEAVGIKYVSVGGSAITKIHIYSYVGMGVFVTATGFYGLSKYRCVLGPLFEAWLYLLLSIVYLIIYGLVAQGTSGMAYVVDSLLVPVMMFPVVALLSNEGKKALLSIITVLVLANCITAVLEYVFKFKIWDPGFDNFYYFRSTAWFGHSLNNALIVSSVSIALIRHAYISPILIFSTTVLSLFAFGARAAAVIFMLVALLVMMRKVIDLYKVNRKQGVYKMVRGLALALAGVFMLAYFIVEFKVGSRVFDNLLIDASAQTRLDVFDVFKYLSFHEYFFGASEQILSDLPRYINNDIVENYVIGWFLQYGLLGMLPLLLAYVFFMAKVFVSGDMYVRGMVFVFVLVSLANNALSVKTPALLFFMIVAACCLKDLRLQKVAAPHSWR